MWKTSQPPIADLSARFVSLDRQVREHQAQTQGTQAFRLTTPVNKIDLVDHSRVFTCIQFDIATLSDFGQAIKRSSRVFFELPGRKADLSAAQILDHHAYSQTQ